MFDDCVPAEMFRLRHAQFGQNGLEAVMWRRIIIETNSADGCLLPAHFDIENFSARHRFAGRLILI